MKILFVDTTTSDLVVALVNDVEVIDFSVTNCGVRHSETLCSVVGAALEKCALAFSDLDAFACSIGPGSFTGIRIGVSTVKGYAFATGKPMIEVNCLEALALSERCGKKLSAVLDAGNGYYFADFVNNVAPCLISYDDERAQYAAKCVGATEYLDGAVAIIRKKAQAGEYSQTLSPLYVRRSQAEEKR